MGLPVVSLDFETCSQVDLRKVSAWRYAEDATTRVICAAYAVDDGRPKLWRPGDPVPNIIWMASWGDARIAAWNANFEWAILCRIMHQHGWPDMPLEAMRCTMAASAFAGFPMSLDHATKALGLPTDKLKDDAGRDLMLRMARPRSRRPLTWWHETEPDRLRRLEAYCVQDVEAERAARLSLVGRCPGQITPDGFLPDYEQDVWEADQRVNERGVTVDLALVDALGDIVDEEMALLNAEMERATGGSVRRCTDPAGIKAWINRSLEARGLPGRVTVLDKNILPKLVRRANKLGFTDIEHVLRLRVQAAKSSTAKLKSLALATSGDHRLRGTLQYYGAQRTGRWAGRVFQPQNIPRGVFPKGFDTAGLIAAVLAANAADRHRVMERLLPPGLSVMDAASSLLRGCLVGPERGSGWVNADPRGDLYCPDLSQIEARVINWLASNRKMLEVFASGDRDPYVFAANEIGSSDRQLGKVCTLGLGFGMGGPKFQATAAKAPYFIRLSEDQARGIVRAWRKANRRIEFFWRVIEAAFRKAMARPGHRFAAGKHIVAEGLVGPVIAGRRTVDVILWLPGGRPLYYRNCRTAPDPRWPEGVPAIVFDGIDPKTKRWGKVYCYGGKLAENVTQAIARDLIALALVWLEANGTGWGLAPVLSVHDELVLENIATGAHDMVTRTIDHAFGQWPACYAGLPVAHETKHGARYAK